MLLQQTGFPSPHPLVGLMDGCRAQMMNIVISHGSFRGQKFTYFSYEDFPNNAIDRRTLFKCEMARSARDRENIPCLMHDTASVTLSHCSGDHHGFDIC